MAFKYDILTLMTTFPVAFPCAMNRNACSVSSLLNTVVFNGLTTPSLRPWPMSFDTWSQSGSSSTNSESNKIPWMETFFNNIAMPNGVFWAKLCLLVSRKRPSIARQRKLACSLSPVSEFKMTSHPFPPVACITWVSNDVSREKVMFSSCSWGKMDFKYSRFCKYTGMIAKL